MAQFEIRPKWCKAMNNHAFWNFVGRVPAQFWTDWQGKCSGITCKHKWPNWALKNKNVMSCNTLRAIEFFVILFLKGIFWLGHKVSFEHSFIHTADNVRFFALALKIYCLYNILFLTQQITERNHCSLKKKVVKLHRLILWAVPLDVYTQWKGVVYSSPATLTTFSFKLKNLWV